MLKITLAVFVVCFIIERHFAGWKLPKVHSWYTRVVVINVFQLGVVLLAGATWEHWFASVSLLHFSNHLAPWPAGFLAYFIATFVFYWWHRMRHESVFFWRYFHQIHQSPQRLPQWVGYIFQRPEMHRIHHQYNYHKNNYGDFVLWDMMFGTYENPKT